MRKFSGVVIHPKCMKNQYKASNGAHAWKQPQLKQGREDICFAPCSRLKRQTSSAKMKHRPVDFRTLFLHIFVFYKLAFQIKWNLQATRSHVCQSASPSDVWGLAWSLTGGADDDWEPFWRRVTSWLCWGRFCRNEGFDTWWKVAGVGSQRHYPVFSWAIAGKERVASLVRASEHTDVKPVAGRTLFCWQCVFLLSLRLLQFGLVKGCDLRDVWFVTHVCRQSSRDKPQLEQQAVMRTREGKLQRGWGWGR